MENNPRNHTPGPDLVDPPARLPSVLNPTLAVCLCLLFLLGAQASSSGAKKQTYKQQKSIAPNLSPVCTFGTPAQSLFNPLELGDLRMRTD